MNFFKTSVNLVLLTLLIGLPANTAFAQTKAKDPLVATVNGQEIRASDVNLAARDILPQLSRIAPKQRLAFMTQYLVERYLIAQEAERVKMNESQDFKNNLAFYRRKALRDTYISSVIVVQVTEQLIKATYEKGIKGVKPKEELRARHILVKTEKQAKIVVAALKKGADFAALAKKHSIGPTKVRGGDLGYFNEKKMVPVFFQAASKLKKGQFSNPVKSRFGWHVIKLEDRRSQKIPSLAQMRATIRNRLIRQKVEQLAASLRAKAKITLPEAVLKPKTKTKSNKTDKSK